MKQLYMALAAAPLLIATAALAAEQQPTSDRPERRICRSEQKTGSLVPRRRVCRTESEWREIQKTDKAGVDVFRDNVNRPCNYSTSATSC
jgi:hypothetical protein